MGGRRGKRRSSLSEKTRTSSGQDAVDDLAVNVGQAEVAPGVTAGQALVVDAHEVEDYGAEIANVDLVLDRDHAEFVDRVVVVAPVEAAASQPHGKAQVVMVRFGPLRRGRASKLSAPDDQRLVEQSATSEVAQQGRNRAITLLCIVPVVC